MDAQRRVDTAACQPRLDAAQYVQQAMVDREHAIGLQITQYPANIQILVAVIAAGRGPVSCFQFLVTTQQLERTAIAEQFAQTVFGRVGCRACIGEDSSTNACTCREY